MAENGFTEEEALLIVREAIKLGVSQDVERGVLVGCQSTEGRFVMYVSEEVADDMSGPTFKSAEEAAVWIRVEDERDSFDARELQNAILNWRRLASRNSTSEDLYELGEGVVQAIGRVFRGGGNE